jgi:Uma2 family endonuclease
MATATLTPEMTSTSSPVQAPIEWVKKDQRVEFVGIGWAGYEALLEIQGEKSRPQIIYLDGDAYLVSPSNLHEWLKKRLGQFVVEIAVGLKIRFLMAGETTFRRRKKEVGVQPDESFYLANADQVADKIRKVDIDLSIDPPPDLAIEVVHTHGADEAVEVLRRLRVPEVWVADEGGLRILIRKRNGRYVESKASLAFPFLTADEIFERANHMPTGFDLDWTEELRQWIQEVLVPRVRGKGQ